ncbi:hypothetical protein BKA70DRAFT_1214823 [Coprinopsis sp. MPI-PUGE-AT-0042]|nr:hypothetical protein BKA70DRAFT_1214823 [Coprinopsis sp. MPI-PUGE-AT-0042]
MQLAQIFLLVAFGSYGAVGVPTSPIPPPKPKRDASNSRWTFYEVPSGPTACGTFQSNADFIVALNAEDFGAGDHCGKTITLSRDGKTAKAQIQDICVGCPLGALDLTPGLFEFFAPLEAGIIQGDWKFD